MTFFSNSEVKWDQQTELKRISNVSTLFLSKVSQNGVFQSSNQKSPKN